jgi:hypothetical protein
MPRSINPKYTIEQLVTLILKERRRKLLTAVRSMWQIGDGVRRLKRAVGSGAWGSTIESCAVQVNMHAASLDEAARAAEAFSAAERKRLHQRVEHDGVELTPSHVIALARALPRKRARGIEALLTNHYTVRELRSYLRKLSL